VAQWEIDVVWIALLSSRRRALFRMRLPATPFGIALWLRREPPAVRVSGTRGRAWGGRRMTAKDTRLAKSETGAAALPR